MLSRPWPLIILAALHFLSPVLSFLLSLYILNTGPLSYLQWQWDNSSLLTFVSLYLAYPIAGYLIYKCKKWSYYAYFCFLFYTVVFNYIVWAEEPYLFNPLHAMFFFSTNSLLFIYFLSPSVRRVYLNPRIRWWESESRYLVKVPAQVNEGKEVLIQNISENGALINVIEPIDLESPISLSFFDSTNNETVLISADIKNHRGLTYGVRFSSNDQEKKQVKTFIKDNVIPNSPERDQKSPSFENFVIWLMHLLKTGQGIFPRSSEIYNHIQKKKKLKKKRIR